MVGGVACGDHADNNTFECTRQAHHSNCGSSSELLIVIKLFLLNGREWLPGRGDIDELEGVRDDAIGVHGLGVASKWRRVGVGSAVAGMVKACSSSASSAAPRFEGLQ